MKKESYFHNVHRKSWLTLKELEPYFASAGSGWFHDTGNDSAGFDAKGVDGTAHLPEGGGRIDVDLSMWGIPEHGILLTYKKVGGGFAEAYCSKGDLRHLRTWVRSLHDDPMPVGLFIPFPKAWLAVKEFIETNGKLPRSIDWVRSADLPAGTFPDP